jgi:hypothetical protein
VPDPKTDDADSFGFAEPIEVVTEGGAVKVKADKTKIDSLKWFCTYDSSKYYFWTTADASTRKQMFISSEPKGGIKLYDKNRSVEYADRVMSAEAETGINYVIFEDTKDSNGLQFTGVLVEDGSGVPASENTTIYLFRINGTEPAPDPTSDVETAKTTAKADIDSVLSDKNLAKYDTADQAKIKELAKTYKDKIDKAATATEVAKLVEAFKADIGKIQTSEAKKKDADAKLTAQVKNTKVKIKKPKTGKKKVTAKWTANKTFDGYQVSYKIKGKGKWKKVTAKGASTSKKVIKKLKKGKKYQIKVRGYKTINGAKVYGKYSKTKTTGKVK